MVVNIIFFKKEVCTDFVDLSVGRIYIKPLNNGIINSVAAKSTIAGSILNNAMYFGLMEYALVELKPKQIDALSVKDGENLRTKIKEILARHNLIITEEEKEEFAQDDKKIFEEQEKHLKEMLRSRQNAPNRQSNSQQ